MGQMFRKILIANRGEIACRIMRTARRMGIATVAIYSDADTSALHVELADEAIRVGPAKASESYLNEDAIIKAALECGAEAVHPGYGFLSENPHFVEAVEAAGLIFIGPSAPAIRAMGLKDAAKALMEKAGVPVVPGYHGTNQDEEYLAAKAGEIGYPVLIKARAGGGGKGMRRVDEAAQFRSALDSAKREARASFGDDAVLVEKYMAKPRHVEVQVFGDNHGHHVYLFERDCSLQRRHQKVIEEAPAPGMTPEMRATMGEAAVRAAAAIDYSGAGTVEFIADVSEGLRSDRFFFMEMNTRLQVEHPVTEAITGLDLVEWQLRVAAGDVLPKRQDELTINGWAFEARLYAEDPARDFLPQIGTLHLFDAPADVARVDSGVRTGDTITPFYDPMIAKLIVHGPDRAQALARLETALDQCRIAGLTTNRQFLGRLCRLPEFRSGDVDTGVIARSGDELFAEPAPGIADFALAALRVLDVLKPASGLDPWDSLRGLRLWEPATQAIALEYGGGQCAIRVTFGKAGTFTIDHAGESIDLIIRAYDGVAVRFELRGHVLSASVVGDAYAVTVQIAGQSHLFRRVTPGIGDDDMGAGGSRIMAPMPGLIRIVRVAEGDLVNKGDTLIIMEAMKMELSLAAPRDGVVKSITVLAGDQVAEGRMLLELVEEGSDA